MMPYIQIFMDKEEALNLLSDAERGRLLSALMEYNRTGVCAQLTGNERLVFPFFRDALDASKRLYEQRAEASAKGGEARKQADRKPNTSRPEAEGKPNTSREEAEKKPEEAEGKPNEAKNKNKNKNKKEEEVRGGETTAAPFLTDDEAEALQEDLDTVLDAALDAGLADNNKTRDALTAMVAEYGAELVLDVIDRAVEGDNRGGISIAFIRRIAQCMAEDNKPKSAFTPNPRMKFQLVGSSGEVVGELGLPAQS